MSSSYSQQALIDLFPQDREEILSFSDEDLVAINNYLAGNGDKPKCPNQSTITVDVSHTMVTTNHDNKGRSPKPQEAHGFRCSAIPKFPPGTPYTVEIKQHHIILTVGGVVYVYLRRFDVWCDPSKAFLATLSGIITDDGPPWGDSGNSTSRIAVDRAHNMRKSNKENNGSGGSLPQDVEGYRPGEVPKFEKGTPYTITLEPGKITLKVPEKVEVDGGVIEKEYVYTSPKCTKSGTAYGTITE